MKHTLVVYVSKQGEDYRILLWKGRPIYPPENPAFTAVDIHSNLFRLLGNLRDLVLDWARDAGIPKVHGIHNSLACWPLDVEVPPLMAIKTLDKLNLADAGLRLIGHRDEGGCQVKFLAASPGLNTFWNLEILPGSWSAGTIGRNIFVVADRVRASFIDLAHVKGIEQVSGIHNEDQLWPEGL